jgi:hypothetical protein
MQFFQVVPAIDPIGVDLKQMLSYSESWFFNKQTPYIGFNLYPPLASVLFTPLIFVKFFWAYKIITFINVFCYVMSTFIFPLRVEKEKHATGLLVLIFITGLLSYGFQFELERGQFNIIASFLCFLAIWIFHFHNKYRLLAYILFALSVQLKIFPFIFIVMFINNWQDWKSNIKRILILALVNFLLLFIMGPTVFIDFIEAILAQTVYPAIWQGNHSIRSFVAFFSTSTGNQGWLWGNQYDKTAQFLLLAGTLICILIIIFQAYRQNEQGVNPLLLLACTIGALVIPSVSHDYKLSILAAPVALLFSSGRFFGNVNSSRIRLTLIGLLLIFSASYSSTLYSFTNKPFILSNNLPALIIMLLVVTILSIVTKGNIIKPIETSESQCKSNIA